MIVRTPPARRRPNIEPPGVRTRFARTCTNSRFEAARTKAAQPPVPCVEILAKSQCRPGSLHGSYRYQKDVARCERLEAALIARMERNMGVGAHAPVVVRHPEGELQNEAEELNAEPLALRRPIDPKPREPEHRQV